MTADLDRALIRACTAVRAGIAEFGRAFPGDCTIAGRYRLRPPEAGVPAGGNVGWTTGFRTGLLWLAGQLTGDAVFTDAARADVASFAARLDAGVGLDTHDLGFLFGLSCLPAWRLERDKTARAVALNAADRLMARVIEPAGVIQAWGSLGDPDEGGLTIIDSLMNMPLLYWATEQTGDARYAAAAARHTRALRDRIVRRDGTTFHTFTWDPVTGFPRGGGTRQGFSADSCWARGQAWAIYGFALGYARTGDATFLDASRACADRFCALLPPGGVPCWDLALDARDGAPRDSSAAAIAACGLLELASSESEAATRRAREATARRIVESLARDYAAPDDSSALILHGVYDMPKANGVDEGTLWGDYFYLEALARLERPGVVLGW